jgi:tetratricopeptide (TPR) repeat protein
MFPNLSLIDSRFEHGCACDLLHEPCCEHYGSSYLGHDSAGIKSDQAAAWVCLGLVLIDRGRFKKAIKAFERACFHSPTDDSIKKQLDELKAQRGTHGDEEEDDSSDSN